MLEITNNHQNGSRAGDPLLPVFPMGAEQDMVRTQRASRVLSAGIARLAAFAPKELEKKDVEYYRLGVRSLLNRVDSRRVGFLWSVNPYRGCEFGCQYCYARYTHEYMELNPQEFESKIYVKEAAAPTLLRDLTPEKVFGEHIAIGAATDPYQPAERRFGVTRSILEALLEWLERLPPEAMTDRSEAGVRRAPLSVSITTKSNLVVRDLPLLVALSQRARLYVNISVTTLEARLARLLEPRAPRPDLRLAALRELVGGNLRAGVFLAPILPAITDGPAALEGVVSAAAQARACYLCANVVFLMPSSQKRFFPFLEEKFPRLVKQYRKWYARNGYAPEEYRREISRLMKRLRARYGLEGHWPDQDHSPDYSALLSADRAQLQFPWEVKPNPAGCTGEGTREQEEKQLTRMTHEA
jgi:DNA repair photolyase